MVAGRYNFTIEQGAQFDRLLTWQTGTPLVAVDLTGFSARVKLKDGRGQQLLSLTTVPTSNGDVITLGGTAGTIEIVISDETTTALDFDEATYDLELVSPAGAVVRLLEGVVDLSREVTT